MGIAIAAATAFVVVTAGSVLLPRSHSTESPAPAPAAQAPVAQPTSPAPSSPAAPVATAPTPPAPAGTGPNPPSSPGSAPVVAQQTDNKADAAAETEPSRVVAATEPGASPSAPSEAKPSSPVANDEAGSGESGESGKDPGERAPAKKHDKEREKDRDKDRDKAKGKDRDKDKDKTADKTASGKKSAGEVSDASGDKRSKSSPENAVLPPSDGSVPEPAHQSGADCVLPEKDMAREAWRRNWPTVCAVGDRAFVLIPIKGTTQGEVHELRHHPNREARVTLPATSESQLSMKQYKINRLGFKDLRINPMDAGGTRFRLKLDPEGGDPSFEVKDGYAKITIAPPPGQN